MHRSIINPDDSLERQNEKLLKISGALMRRVEQSTKDSGADYAQFQRAVMLEEEIRNRTRDLEHALNLLNESNKRLALANNETEAARSNLANAIETVQEGFALFNPDEQLVMCNSRFGMHMPDIRDLLLPGLSFRQYVDLVSRSRNLALPEGETADDWKVRRLKRHQDEHVMFNVRLADDRWVQVSEHRTPDGGTVVLQTDVTDIMRLERQERDRLIDGQARVVRATLEHLNQGICIFDNQSRLVLWNQRVSDMLPIPARRLIIGASFNSLFERFRDQVTFIKGATPQIVQDWITRSGRRAPMHFEIMQGNSKTLAVDAQEMPDRGFVISFTDTTAERAAVQAIRQANEMLEGRVTERTLELEDALAEAERANASKSRFVAAASHDLLQPLSAAKLFVSSLESTMEDDGTRQVLSKTNSALCSVENILEALLDISKLDSGRATIHVSAVSLDDMLQQLQDELAPLAEAKGLDLRILRTGVHVTSDLTYLRRILQNLVSNAIRYTATGRVLVGGRRTPNGIRVEVWDTGPGIPEDKQNLIFDEFERLNATASAADGMGLGLAIVDRACALLNHPLNLRSAPGRGSVFSVELPLNRAVRRAAPAPVAYPISQARLSDRTVVLIEDDDTLRQAMQLTMNNWGIDVLACSSEAEALDKLTDAGRAPELVLADYQLKDGKTGIMALARLRDIYGAVPACIITANRSDGVISECERMNVRLMHKPIEPAQLHAFLMSALPAA
ncbi:hybrid sensor histidine kinase/response regulator [Arenibacterium sp. CAU 1754]